MQTLRLNWALWLMAFLYAAAGVNHFINPGFYVNIMPDYLPAHLALVYLSGVAEIALALGLCIERARRASAWLIIAMLVVFLTVHVHMLVHADRYDVPGWALWLRFPLQAALIYWAWRYTRARPPRP